MEQAQKVAIPGDRDGAQGNGRLPASERRSDEYAPEATPQDGGDHDLYYHDDPQCPCYVCTNGVMDAKSSMANDDTSTGVEFAVRSFWRVAKTQNDVESPMEGHCRGFHYKLLLHPRGTAGTDSEASHLSVFVEASVQDWYPQYWVFPNVRFELTVVNFKDPKQSVTSWAHWSFSSDATSRGWQKMISHTRLTRASGFMDEDGTVLVRGKAEPPYPMLWSNSPLYHPQMMWEYIPNRAHREISADLHSDKHTGGKYKRSASLPETVPCHPACTYELHAPACKNAAPVLPHGDPPYAISEKEREREWKAFMDAQKVHRLYSKAKQKIADAPPAQPANTQGQAPAPPVPPLPLPMQSDQGEFAEDASGNDESDGYTEVNAEDTLMHLQPDEYPGVSSHTILKFLDSVIPALQPTLDADLLALMTHILYHIREFRKHIFMWNPPDPVPEGSKGGNGIIVALQKTFAYMELYPLAAACKTYKLAGIETQHLSKYYLYELLPKLPNVKKGYGLIDYSDGAGTANANNSEKSTNSSFESSSQQNQYAGRGRGQKTGPWNRMHIPTPFPQPSEAQGYNAGEADFKHPNCCYFDGGRYEWELKHRTPSKDENSGDSVTEVQREGADSRPSNIFGTSDVYKPNYKLLPGTLSFSIGNRADVFDKILPPPPNIKLLLKAMHMSDLQVLETQDQLINIHTELFSMIMRDLAATRHAVIEKKLVERKQARVAAAAKSNVDPNSVYLGPIYLREYVALEVTCKSLFSGTSLLSGIFNHGDPNEIPNVYIRCKHSHSLQKALENTTKTMAKFPEVLFFYLHPAKNAKKGELFDIPLRLDCSSLRSRPSYRDDTADTGGASQGQKGSGHGDNTCDSGVSSGAVDYCGYSDEEDDDDEEDEDEEDQDELGSEGFGNFDGDGKKTKHPAHIKWYSLYALILREGDIRSDGTGNNGGNFHSLLLRPEEDGPWYRIAEGRVEKLSTKMEFTEWKCHRDFFCAAAVYIAEDYIDMMQVGEVDVNGNLKTWNPKLYYETLQQLGVTESDIANPAIRPMSEWMSEHPTPRPYYNEGDSELMTPRGSATPAYLSPRSARDDAVTARGSLSEPALTASEAGDVLPAPAQVQSRKDDFVDIKALLGDEAEDLDLTNIDIIYNRKVGQRHPKLGSCCESHGYSSSALNNLNDKEYATKMMQPSSAKEICRRINRAETIRPFIRWLFNASKENTTVLNGVKLPADGKMLVKFLQQRERYFEEEFCHLICEILLKEIGEHMALNAVYRWETDKSWCGCECKRCGENCPAMLLTENGRFAGEELKALLTEPSTILFRNIQILRCHLEYFCKDCRNLSMQLKDEQRVADIREFKATSERSALFLIECIWDACVRYTHDCRTVLYLKAISDNPSASMAELGLNKVSTLVKPSAIPAAKQTNSLNSSVDQCRDLFVFDGTLSQNAELLEGVLIDYYDTKYDLTPAEELRIMRYFAAKYQLPPVSQMRKFLRQNHVLVFCYIRPHELLRAYLEVKNPGINVKEEIEAMLPSIIWNDAAFEQRVTISSLTDEEKAAYGIDSDNVDIVNGVGHNLCDIYEQLIAKMLLHMQDAERGMSTKVLDYIYTCGDVAKVVGAIEAECRKTITNSNLVVRSKSLEDICKCTGIAGGCKISPVMGGTTYFPDFGVSRGPFALDFVEIQNNEPWPSGLRSECASFTEEVSDMTAKPADAKRKQKAKERKKTVDSAACIIPPLDQALRDVNISQRTAHAADPKLFPDLTEVIKYPNGAHCLGNTGALAKLRRWGEYNSLLFHQTLGYDFNVAGGFASMLKVENHGSKATPHPLLEDRKFNEAQSLRIKHAFEIGIVTTHDLSGCEGFASEEKLVPTKRLLVYHEYVNSQTGKKAPVKVEHLYWGLRRLLQQQVPADMDSVFVQASKGKKGKGSTKCVCGGRCDSDEYECTANMRWKPLPRDCFVLYALRPDNNNPIRRGRRRFTFMNPESELSQYVEGTKKQVNPKTPDLVVLIVGAPLSLCSTPTTPFPLTDDTDYPLLLFKWMCTESVDLICYGAVVCDAKKQLQHYIFDWLLPLVRESGTLPKLGPNEKEDIERYQILEECSVRTVQNVRRWSCAIRKINKRTGDIIIAQLKRLTDSPATLKLRETTAFLHTVRELEELQTLEFLPPAERIDEIIEISKGKVESIEPLPQVVDDTQKLGKKKKKKKVTKSAIPSNKKSTFSKSIVPVESDSEESVAEQSQQQDAAPPTEETLTPEPDAKKTADVAVPITEPETGAPAKEDEEEEDDEDEDEEEEDEEAEEVDTAPAAVVEEVNDEPDAEEAAEEVDIAPLVDDALAAVVSSRTVVDRSAIEKRGLPSGRMQDFLQKVDMPNLLSNDSEMVTQMCSYIQKVIEGELALVVPPISSPSRDQIIITVNSKVRTCIDILLCLIRCMNKNGWLISSFRTMVNAIYEKAPLSAAAIACYALSAMGNICIVENMKSKAAIEFVRDLAKKMADQCVEHSSSIFDSTDAKCTVTSMLMCLYIYSAVNENIAKICDQNSSLIFLMNVVREKLSVVPESDEEERSSTITFRMDALERFLGGPGYSAVANASLADQVNKSPGLMAAFKSVQPPFANEELLMAFERITFQEQKIWWHTREALMSNIKALLDQGVVSFVVVIGDAEARRSRHVDDALPLEMSLAEFKCLQQCCSRYPNELGIAIDVGFVHAGPLNAISTHHYHPTGDAAAVVDAVAALSQLVKSRSRRRTVANVALDEGDQTSVFANLDDMRLWGNQTALVIMSVRLSGTLDSVSTEDVEAILQHYYARTVKTIPPPPRLPPQQPQMDLGVLDRLPDGDEELHRLAAVDQPVVVREREVHNGADRHGVVAHHAALDYRVHAQDGGLRRVDDRRAEDAAVHATVGNRECTAGHVGHR
ncbi:RNA pseudouridine synthase superfamily protein [Babesia ovata]|uniref:RNA pseudouridine synthase superfamily protein n=1 Tax=Babesia ovata TaxID=189622 RepID=A0A2H6K9T5_9APIC|nr:RNA pseudouridine synthase superfamily protein [Babesia ovata]GBE59745.1 RNA pseudouridine synthase superfamily protein [Babesia ovata]